MTPIFYAHGSDDDVIPIARAMASRNVLASLGHRIEWHDYPMPHAVCSEEIRAIEAWLGKALA